MTLSRDVLFDKIYACWLGKNIGGTLGAPVEGVKEPMQLTWYPKTYETGAVENDDLDLQLCNLQAAERYGTRLSSTHLARGFLEHVFFPYDEYGYALTALRSGLTPPFSGCYDNPFIDCMGSPIRSELWACIAPGNPGLAAYLAYQDAVVDHAGGEGMYGEIFQAALQSLAFICDDKVQLIKQALEYIPSSSRTYRAVADTLRWHQEGKTYTCIRQKILDEHGRDNFTDAPQNIAFTVLGLLSGADFEDGLLKTVNLGYDTDCTVATLGALYGILYGSAYIPQKWSDPIGERIVVSAPIKGLRAPKNLKELTERTMVLQQKFALEDSSLYTLKYPENFDYNYSIETIPTGVPQGEGLTVYIGYPNGASVSPAQPLRIPITLTPPSDGTWIVSARLVCPDGISGDLTGFDSPLLLTGKRSGEITIISKGNIPHQNTLQLIVCRRLADGTLWNEYPIGISVLRAARWKLSGQTHYIDGTKITFDKPMPNGIYLAETTLTLTKELPVRLMFATTAALTVTLDGKEVLSAPQITSVVPAYHRCEKDRVYSSTLSAGTHTLAIRMQSDCPPTIIFAPVDYTATYAEGARYRMLDVEIGI
ncbi:MAG: ADP-ribosylglycohydrolase family protein [Clostridiales bacterium]|nr:ADP-ribosylglycohydrolase family protein [Clostridiales bacterium]